MIQLTRLDGRTIVVNADEIESIDTSFDTTITMISGKRFIVIDAENSIVEKVINYKRKCFSKLPEFMNKANNDGS